MEPTYSAPESPLGEELEGLLNETAVPASTGLRFLDFLIDRIVILVIYGVVRYFLLGAILVDGHTPGPGEEGYWSNLGVTLLITYALDILYYTLFEGTTYRTIGKLCTNTRVVKAEDGSPITLKDALLRSLCRLVPFEVFSGFGTPWHDTWTHTSVTSNRKY